MTDPSESWRRPDGEMPDHVSLHKPPESDQPAEPPLDFDPYRFGAPEHPVPPEYAPPGYRPPPPSAPPYAAGQPGDPGFANHQADYQSNYQAYYQQYPSYQAEQGYGSYGPPPPYATQYPPPHTGNGKAIAALVFGIASIVLCWLTVLDAVPVVLAFVFGGLARGEAKRRPGGEGRGLATAGIVCGIIGAVLAIGVSLWLFNRFGDCLNYNSGSSAYSTCVQNHL